MYGKSTFDSAVLQNCSDYDGSGFAARGIARAFNIASPVCVISFVKKLWHARVRFIYIKFTDLLRYRLKSKVFLIVVDVIRALGDLHCEFP